MIITKNGVNMYKDKNDSSSNKIHIEIIGTSGSGKSTIHSKLVMNENFYSGERSPPVFRMFKKEKGLIAKIAFYVIAPILRAFIFQKSFLKRAFENELFIKFVVKYPNCFKVFSKLAHMESINKEHYIILFKGFIEKYQLGFCTRKQKEIFLQDEGLSSFPAYLIHDIENMSIFIEDYFKQMPTPDIIIHIDTPIERCNYRRLNRGSKKMNERSLKMTRKISFEIINHLKKRYGTNVIYVENTGKVEDAVENIENELKKLGIL